MAGNGHFNPLDRRLQELAQESELLNDDIRKLRRSLEKAARTGQAPEIPPLRHERPPAAEVPASETETLHQRPRFRSAPMDDAPVESAPEAPAREPAPGEERRDFSRNPRFASYLASGSFGKARPLGREKKVQRNKAIFMLIVAMLFAFIVIRVFFY